MNSENKMRAVVYEESIVAFIDILGFKSKVQETINDANYLNTLHEALRAILEWQKESQEEDLDRKTIVFSDSIVFSYPLKSTSALFSILIDIIQIQIQLIQYGLFVRGGISCGKVYHDDSIVFGPALIEAYELEQKAGYPRIIIEKKNLIAALKRSPPMHDHESEIEDVMELIKMDQDGHFFLDFLSAGFEEIVITNPDDYFEWMKKIQGLLIDAESRFKVEPKIYEKYKWFIDYFNEVVSRFEGLKELIIKTNKCFTRLSLQQDN